MPRFVLLYHDCPPNYVRASHWDFMLEYGDVLRTWALERLPRDWEFAHARTSTQYADCPLLAMDNTVAAVQLTDHRRDYLELEGALSGDRGAVVRVAAGTYYSEQESPSNWQVVLQNDDLAGRVWLSRTETEYLQWTLSCS